MTIDHHPDASAYWVWQDGKVDIVRTIMQSIKHGAS
jgi:hypothetical protein